MILLPRIQQARDTLFCNPAIIPVGCLHPGSGSDRKDPHPSTGEGRPGSKGPAAPKSGTACRPVRLTRQDPQCHQIAASQGTREDIAWPWVRK